MRSPSPQPDGHPQAAAGGAAGSGQAPDDALARLTRALDEARAEIAVARAGQKIAERFFEATFGQAPVGIAHVAPDGRFLRVNDQFARICGHEPCDLMRNGFQQITHPDDLEADLAHVNALLAGEADRYVMEKRYLRADGGLVWVNLTVSLVRDEAGAPEFFVSVIEDVSEIKRAHADAIHDPLTGVLNRRGFIDRTTREIARAAIAQDGLSVAYLDLDGFKSINDAHGHPAGDTCLVEVARLIEAATRPGDIVARLGGDEFAMLMPHLSADHAKSVVERVRASLEALGREWRWPLSGSFGVLSLVPTDATSAEQLIAGADREMFRAKHAGKNCVMATAI